MSTEIVFTALRRGAATVVQLAERTGMSARDVGLACASLKVRHLVERVDGGRRGMKATYALVDDGADPAFRARRSPTASHEYRQSPSAAMALSRDPCVKCGVRGDIGCQHEAPARWSMDVPA